MLSDTDLKFIKSIPVLRDATGKAFDLMRKEGLKRNYLKGEGIFWAGEKVERLFIVKSGCIEIYKDDLEGHRLTLWKCHERELFCLASLYVGRAFANAVCLKDSTLISFDRFTVNKLISLCPEIGTDLLSCLSGKLACYSAITDDIAFHDITFRLKKLLYLSANSGNIVDLRLDEMAAMLGTCKEVVSRVLKSLRKDKLIKRRGRQILILDIDRLYDRTNNS